MSFGFLVLGHRSLIKIKKEYMRQKVLVIKGYFMTVNTA